jgi:hypothetical protein
MMDDLEIEEVESTWRYQKTIPIDPDTVDPVRASERMMQVLIDAGVTYNGGPPELSITTMDGDSMTVSINADSDPEPALANIQKLPLLPAEARMNQAITRMKQYAEGMAAGTQPTSKQMATAILDLAIIIRGTG